MGSLPQFDRIGYWSEIKLEIIKEYASAYSTILAAQTGPSFYHVYIDAFAGAGMDGWTGPFRSLFPVDRTIAERTPLPKLSRRNEMRGRPTRRAYGWGFWSAPCLRD